MRKGTVESKVEQLLKDHLKIQTYNSRVKGLVDELLELYEDAYDLGYSECTMGIERELVKELVEEDHKQEILDQATELCEEEYHNGVSEDEKSPLADEDQEA